jgi:serine/threonine protein kinase
VWHDQFALHPPLRSNQWQVPGGPGGNVCACGHANPTGFGGGMNPHHASAFGAGLRLDDRYRLIKQIGSGGMSVVFDAHDEILERQVAVKLLAHSVTADPALPRRLLLEARALAALRHSHITAVHDFGVHRADDGTATPYLVMEMLDGDLLSHVLSLGRMPWQEAVSICAQLAAALAAAHAAGIVHHDISPANIMLTSTGVKVLDFGICASIGDAQHGVDGDIIGTPPYLAPERLGRANVAAAADVYAAGLVLYRCLAGRLPWDAVTVTETLYAHARLEPRSLPPLGLPQAIEDACIRCLSRDSRRRPTAVELTQILTREVRRTAAATKRLSEDPAWPPAVAGQTMTLPIAIGRPRPYRPSRRVLAVAAASCALVGVGYILYLLPTSPQTAAAQADSVAVACSITYITTYTQARQFDATITLTSTARASTDPWTLRFSLPGGESLVGDRLPATGTRQVVDSPQTSVNQQGDEVTLTNTGPLAFGVPVSLTLNGRYGASPTRPPAGFTLNGKPCNAAATLRTIAQPPDTAITVVHVKPGKTPQGPRKREQRSARP